MVDSSTDVFRHLFHRVAGFRTTGASVATEIERDNPVVSQVAREAAPVKSVRAGSVDQKEGRLACLVGWAPLDVVQRHVAVEPSVLHQASVPQVLAITDSDLTRLGARTTASPSGSPLAIQGRWLGGLPVHLLDF
jgi:hypothetical protein